MSAAPSSLSGDGLTGTFGSTSGQVTPGYSSCPGNLGLLDVASESIESTSTALLRCLILNATLVSLIFFFSGFLADLFENPFVSVLPQFI